MQLFVNDLTVMDFSYLCPKRGMVGESWIVDLILHGDLDEQSMVLDFGKVKKQVKRIIDDTVDHKLVVPTGYPKTRVQHLENDYIRVEFGIENDLRIDIACPNDAFCFIDGSAVEMDEVVNHLAAVIKPQLPVNVKKVELSLRTEAISGFYYHYTHGLKKHDGNCQRIAHGHRSKIQIFENGMKHPRLEKHWSTLWQDIYVATTEDLVEPTQLTFTQAGENEVAFQYESSQGQFELVMPESRVYMMHVDTTVELIAQHIADVLKSEHPENSYKIVAYEGVAKGAIAYAD